MSRFDASHGLIDVADGFPLLVDYPCELFLVGFWLEGLIITASDLGAVVYGLRWENAQLV